MYQQHKLYYLVFSFITITTGAQNVKFGMGIDHNHAYKVYMTSQLQHKVEFDVFQSLPVPSDSCGCNKTPPCFKPYWPGNTSFLSIPNGV